MLGVLLGHCFGVVYFVVSSYGDSGTEFEVECEVNSSSIDVLLGIDVVDAAPGRPVQKNPTELNTHLKWRVIF